MTYSLSILPINFQDKIVVLDSGCWHWTGALTRGYGKVKHLGETNIVHRVSYELFKGPIIFPLQIDHLCRNRACCNPEHLEAVTSRENTMRGVALSAQNARKTHCIHGHEYTPDNTMIDCGYRRCVTCYEMKKIKMKEARKNARAI